MIALNYLLNLLIYMLIPFLVNFLLSILVSFSYYEIVQDIGFSMFYAFYSVIVGVCLVIDQKDNEMYFFKFK